MGEDLKELGGEIWEGQEGYEKYEGGQGRDRRDGIRKMDRRDGKDRRGWGWDRIENLIKNWIEIWI